MSYLSCPGIHVFPVCKVCMAETKPRHGGGHELDRPRRSNSGSIQRILPVRLPSPQPSRPLPVERFVDRRRANQPGHDLQVKALNGAAGAIRRSIGPAPKKKIRSRPQYDHLCPDLPAKISHFLFIGNRGLLRPSRPHAEGRTRRHDTERRGAVAAGLSGAFARTNGSLRTVKPCGPGAPMLALSWR